MSDTSNSRGKQCSQCKFYRSPVDGKGECRFHAPVPPPPPMKLSDGSTLYYTNRFWPIVDATDWCREHVFVSREAVLEWYKTNPWGQPKQAVQS